MQILRKTGSAKPKPEGGRANGGKNASQSHECGCRRRRLPERKKAANGSLKNGKAKEKRGNLYGSVVHAYAAMVFVTAAAMMDLYSGKVKNAWICAGFGVGLLLMFLPEPAFGWSEFAAGVLSAFLIGWIPFRLRALGAGDVKVFMVLGCLIGGEDILWCILFSFLFTTGIYLGRMLSLGQLKLVLKNTFLYLQYSFHYLQMSLENDCSSGYSKGRQAGDQSHTEYSEIRQTEFNRKLGYAKKKQPETDCSLGCSEKMQSGTDCGSGCSETGQAGSRVRFTIYILLGYVLWLGVKFCGVLA